MSYIMRLRRFKAEAGGGVLGFLLVCRALCRKPLIAGVVSGFVHVPTCPLQDRNVFQPAAILVPPGLHKSMSAACNASGSSGGADLAWRLLVGSGVKLLGDPEADERDVPEAATAAAPPLLPPRGAVGAGPAVGGILGMVS